MLSRMIQPHTGGLLSRYCWRLEALTLPRWIIRLTGESMGLIPHIESLYFRKLSLAEVERGVQIPRIGAAIVPVYEGMSIHITAYKGRA